MKAIGPISAGLYKVIKCSIEKKKFPTDWKTGKVTCLYKKGSKSNCNNYRPITLLSVASKVLEKVILDQLTDHLKTQNLISPNQWGFRTGRSTESILLNMTEKWHSALDEGKVVACIFIDFKKAFDVVPHKTLFKKLQASGISGSLYNIITSYLSGRKQYTTVNGFESERLPVTTGVPQGSLLGPQLFSSDINDLPENVEDGDTDMFADDSTCFEICNDYAEAFRKANLILNQLKAWADRNGFRIHIDIGKTEIMFIAKNPFTGPLPSFNLGTHFINVTNKVKCLGLIIDNKLKWKDQTNNICKNFNIKLKNLHKMRFLDQKRIKDIYFKGILPSILYCIAIWGGCLKSDMEKINAVHVKAARFIQRIKKSVPDNKILEHANWRSISWYCKRRTACITYKLFYEMDPNKNIITKRIIDRNLRNNLQIQKHHFKSVKYKNSFNYRCATIWNKLPDKIKELDYDQFKK